MNHIALRPHNDQRPAPPPVPFDDDEEDSDGVPLAAPDALANEPLSDAEVKQLENHEPRMSEEREGALEALRKVSEVDLPIDPDAAASMPVATDEELHLHLRRKARR